MLSGVQAAAGKDPCCEGFLRFLANFLEIIFMTPENKNKYQRVKSSQTNTGSTGHDLSHNNKVAVILTF